MLSILFLLIASLISIITFFRFPLGFSLVVAARIFIPPIVRVGLGPLDISMNTFLTFMLFCVLVVRISWKKQEKIKFPIYFRYLAIYLLYSFLVTLIVSRTPFGFQFGENVQFVVTEIMLGVIALYAMSEMRFIKQFVYILAITSIIVCFYGLFTYAIKSNPYISLINIIYGIERDFTLGIEEVRGVIDGRLQGTAVHYLIWGQTLVIIFAFLLFFKGKINKYIFSIASVLLVVNSFLSGSRSVLLSLYVCFFFLFLQLKSVAKLRAIVIVVISYIFMIMFFANNPYFEKISKTLEATIYFWDESKSQQVGIGGSSVSGRAEQLEATFEIVQDGSQLFGLGKGWIGTYVKQYGQHPKLYGFESVIFVTIVEQGILGFFIFLFFYFKTYLFLRKKEEKIFDRGSIYLIDVYFISYLLSILFTGIQSTFYMFFLLLVVYSRYLELYEIQKNDKTLIDNTSL